MAHLKYQNPPITDRPRSWFVGTRRGFSPPHVCVFSRRPDFLAAHVLRGHACANDISLARSNTTGKSYDWLGPYKGWPHVSTFE